MEILLKKKEINLVCGAVPATKGTNQEFCEKCSAYIQNLIDQKAYRLKFVVRPVNKGYEFKLVAPSGTPRYIPMDIADTAATWLKHNLGARTAIINKKVIRVSGQDEESAILHILNQGADDTVLVEADKDGLFSPSSGIVPDEKAVNDSYNRFVGINIEEDEEPSKIRLVEKDDEQDGYQLCEENDDFDIMSLFDAED